MSKEKRNIYAKKMEDALKRQKKSTVGACAELLAQKEVEWNYKHKFYKVHITMLTVLLAISITINVVVLLR